MGRTFSPWVQMSTSSIVGQQCGDEILRGLVVTDRQLAASEHGQVVGGGDASDRVEASTSWAGEDGAQLDPRRPCGENL